MFAFLVFGLALCFSVLLPVAILSLRRTVRLQRQSVIHDLQHMFNMKEKSGGQDKVIPSFEIVRNKYFPHMLEFDWVKSGLDHAARETKIETRKPSGSRHPSTIAFILCSIPLVFLSLVCSVFAISAIIAGILPFTSERTFPSFLRIFDLSHALPEQKAVFWVFAVAFFGGYLFVVRSLLRAVNNFDLSPGSFLSAALQLLLGVVTAIVIVVGGLNPAVVGAQGVGVVVPFSLVAAFLIGFIPEFGLRTLYRASRLWLFKREDTELYRSFKATPVEVVDGIDTEIRSRLADFNILSAQNLATANPIMLFVETPYGIYQSIDWVGQAQLFAAVGPKTVIKLWKLGIRTIFDLEKAVLVAGYTTPQIRQAVGLALLAHADEATRKHFASKDKGGELDDASIQAFVQNKLDDLHVHRLRQIANRIEAHLGPENRRYLSAASGTGRPANDKGVPGGRGATPGGRRPSGPPNGLGGGEAATP